MPYQLYQNMAQMALVIVVHPHVGMNVYIHTLNRHRYVCIISHFHYVWTKYSPDTLLLTFTTLAHSIQLPNYRS